MELPAARHTTLTDLRIGIWGDAPYCPVDTDTRTLLEQLGDWPRPPFSVGRDNSAPGWILLENLALLPGTFQGLSAPSQGLPRDFEPRKAVTV